MDLLCEPDLLLGALDVRQPLNEQQDHLTIANGLDTIHAELALSYLEQHKRSV